MKSPSKAVTALLISLCFLSLSAQEVATSLDTRITEPIADGTRYPAAAKPEPIDFTVVRSHTERVYVEKSPEMPGLPAPKGTINLTVELVKQPTLEDPPPLPALEPEDPAVVARMGELAQEYPGTQLVFVSASVYKNSITQFRIQPSGPDAKEITGWSNINFNHFSGFASYQVKEADEVVREYGLIMGIGDMNTPDPALTIPRLPDLATQGPAFILSGGDIKNQKTKELIEGIHNLYKVEGPRLAEAYRQRIKAYEERKTFLLANPPKPKDVTIRFWNRESVTSR